MALGTVFFVNSIQMFLKITVVYYFKRFNSYLCLSVFTYKYYICLFTASCLVEIEIYK